MKDFSRLMRDLKDELQKQLPGEEAQLVMSSMKRIRELLVSQNRSNAVKSSVLIILYPFPEDKILFALIQRPMYDGVHGGQISLPGGRAEETDKDLTETALRESSEEIGSDPSEIQILGSLSELFIPPSNHLVLPIIGYADSRPMFRTNPREVEELLEISLDELTDDKAVKWKDIYVRPGVTIYGPCFEIGGYTIWGATAMILNEFKTILKKITDLKAAGNQ